MVSIWKETKKKTKTKKIEKKMKRNDQRRREMVKKPRREIDQDRRMRQKIEERGCSTEQKRYNSFIFDEKIYHEINKK